MVLPGYNPRNVRPSKRIELLKGDENKECFQGIYLEFQNPKKFGWHLGSGAKEGN
jgi:hypothetical protein